MTYFDDNEDRIIYGRFRHRNDDEEPHEPECKFCGSTSVRWRQQGGKWVLFSLEPGKLHQCPIKTDDFDVVKE